MSSVCIVCDGSYGPCKLPGLRECLQCGFVTADLSLSPAELRALYSERYFRGGEYRDYVSERWIHEKHFRRRLEKLRYHLSDRCRLLFEIGCAYGFFLFLAKLDFERVAGIDVSHHATQYAVNELGLEVSCGEFLDYRFDAAPDAVCLWDTIEHVVDPGKYVARLASVMDTGSILAITTSDIKSVVARLRGNQWRQLHPPTHLHYFSRRTLTRLLERNGFVILEAEYEGTYRSLDTAAYIILNIKHSWPTLYRALRSTGLLNTTVYLNSFDTMLVVARRT